MLECCIHLQTTFEIFILSQHVSLVTVAKCLVQEQCQQSCTGLHVTMLKTIWMLDYMDYLCLEM